MLRAGVASYMVRSPAGERLCPTERVAHSCPAVLLHLLSNHTGLVPSTWWQGTTPTRNKVIHSKVSRG